MLHIRERVTCYSFFCCLRPLLLAVIDSVYHPSEGDCIVTFPDVAGDSHSRFSSDVSI